MIMIDDGEEGRKEGEESKKEGGMKLGRSNRFNGRRREQEQSE